MLRNERIIARVKERVHKSVVRPAIMYAAEAWAAKRARVKELEVAEMRMLTFMCALTKHKHS